MPVCLIILWGGVVLGPCQTLLGVYPDFVLRNRLWSCLREPILFSARDETRVAVCISALNNPCITYLTIWFSFFLCTGAPSQRLSGTYSWLTNHLWWCSQDHMVCQELNLVSYRQGEHLPHSNTSTSSKCSSYTL